MSDDFTKQARKVADSSGFPLQIKISNLVKSIEGWTVLEEHPWHFPITNSSGYIDLVIMKEDKTLVIECKRRKETLWDFLIPQTSPSKRSHARLWCTEYSGSKVNRFGWHDFQVYENSYESEYCAIIGTKHGSRNLLERTASELIEAVEALALQENELQEKNFSDYFQNRIYIPVIVTTADLVVSDFDPEAISLKDGSLPPESSFYKVPSVRFRKSLTTRLPDSHISSIREAHQATVRTVFIVNAEKFCDFLKDLSISKMY
jgi:hypothetical protein